MYVDGTASISIRQNVAKIDFYQALPIIDKDGADVKKAIKNNKLEVIGANYSLKSGAVDFLT
jgi:hypothetical protein